MRILPVLLITAAVCSAAVTPPEQIKVPPGFKVELLREAGPREGSWICMTQDDQGRLYISPQGAIPESGFGKDSKWGGMWRTTIVMTENPTGNIQPHVIEWEKVNVPVGDAMGMLWAFDSLYVSGNGPQGRGIYRCTSSKRDGNLDTATLFKAIPGGAGEHGAHAIVLGPDKKLYIVNGNSTGIPDGLDPGSPYRHWGEDDLLPRLKDPVATFFDKIKAPYGCVYRTDADGTKWELFAGGFRNPYDIAFNADGELFTYDSDMEWDRGLPWYRPTRILHVVPGGEYGFREGSAKWPAYFPDSLPAAADIGVGCPTGMKFGTDAKGWSEKYRRALFLHDWTYGRILAVTLHEKGASYTARNDLASYTYPRDAEANGDVEVFLSGKGMPVTDLEFLRDGSMVFTVGGRGTAAALYRVSYLEKGAASENDVPRGRVGVPPAVPGVPPGTSDVTNAAPRENPSAKERPTTPDASRGTRDAAGGTPTLPARDTVAAADATRSPSAIGNAPEAQGKLAGGAASEASATTGSPSAKASAPDGAQEHAIARAYRRYLEGEHSAVSDAAGLLQMNEKVRTIEQNDAFTYSAARSAAEKLPQDKLLALALEEPQFSTAGKYLIEPLVDGPLISGGADTRVQVRDAAHARALDGLMGLLALARAGDAPTQTDVFQTLGKYPLASLDDDIKLLKLRTLELSFARQGRPSEERVKALMEELLAHYPVPPIPANAATPARNPAAGAPVDAPAWRLNRELCALLTWLSNPELGELNADLVEKAKAAPGAKKPDAPSPASGKDKTGEFRPRLGPLDEKNEQIGRFSAQISGLTRPPVFPGATPDGSLVPPVFPGASTDGSIVPPVFPGASTDGSIVPPVSPGASPDGSLVPPVFPGASPDGSLVPPVFPGASPDGSLVSPVFPGASPDGSLVSPVFPGASTDGSIVPPVFSGASSDGSIVPPVFPGASPNGSGAPPDRSAPETDNPIAQPPPFLAQAKTPLDPEKEGTAPAPPKTAPASLGPVPNPGADIFPGRKGAAFHAELGRQVIEKTLALMEAPDGGTRSVVSPIEQGADGAAPTRFSAPSQEEQIWYALCLRWAHGWTPELRVRYFRWFHEKAARYTGGNSFAKFVEAIRADAASRVPESDRAALADWLRPVASPVPAAALKPRAFVKAWTLPELEAALDKLKDRQPDLARGKDLYTQAQCAQCHLFRDAGGNVGPDLTAVAQRFGRHDILESITDPSKVVSEQYAMVTLTVLDGKGGTAEVSGLVKDESSATITILTDPLAGKTSNLYKNVVVKTEKAAVSSMPPGLLNTLTAEEVADLLGLFGAK